MIVRRCHQNVLARHLGFLSDHIPQRGDHLAGGADQIERDDRRLSVLIGQQQHAGSNRIADAVRRPHMPDDRRIGWRSDVDFRHGGSQVRLNGELKAVLRQRTGRADDHERTNQDRNHPQ